MNYKESLTRFNKTVEKILVLNVDITPMWSEGKILSALGVLKACFDVKISVLLSFFNKI